ncbi:MAG: type II secretion system F family protein [Burkholderiaceae bacterium]
MFLLPSLIFLSVACGLGGIFLWLLPTKAEERLRATLTEPTDKSPWQETVVAVVGPFARLSIPSGEWDGSPLRIRFLNAGIRYADAHLVYFGAKTLLPLLFAVAAFFPLVTTGAASGINLALYVGVAATVGCYLPNLVLAWMARRRTREIFESFPDATDLMLVCVEAGLSLDGALTKVAEEIRMKSLALAEELHLTNLEMRAGATREASLQSLALRTGLEEIRTFAVMLAQADRFGTSVGDSLRVFSDDLRHKRQVRAEEAAAKIPTKLLFPLVLCIFPSIIMVVLGPAVVQVVRTILPAISGHS